MTGAGLILACLPLVAPLATGFQEATGTIVAVQVHGNHTTPDADVLALSGVAAGQVFTPGLPAEIERRLRESGRFRSVEVRRRYASLTDLSAIVLVIVVEERVGIAIDVPDPSPMRRLRASTMWLPVLRRDDGYGFSYGVRFSFVDLLGRRTRVSAPLTWGGERRAAVEVERTFERGPFTRVIGTAGVWRREHPAAEVGERRTELTVRGERAVSSWFHVAGGGSTAGVSFGGADVGAVRTMGVEAAVDTRRDPALPRNAVYASAGVERLWLDGPADTVRTRLDLRGYAGLVDQTVLAVRALHVSASDPLPPWEQALLGGSATLRGFPLGFRAGDRLAAYSAELLVPFSNPLAVGRSGVALFMDAGAVYGAGERLTDATFDRGVGAGFFVHLPTVGLRVDVARGLGRGTRAHVTLGVTWR